MNALCEYNHSIECEQCMCLAGAYLGNKDGVQTTPFVVALKKVMGFLSDVGIEVVDECIDLKKLKESSWTLSNFVDWLLGGHVHFIVTHVHQGLV